jgi:hypothetical protein
MIRAISPAGWSSSIRSISCRPLEDSRGRMHRISSVPAPKRCPATRHRNLRIAPNTAPRPSSTSLLPVWLLTYTYGTKNYQVTVNGSTGKITGEYPLSWVKITIAILIGLILLAIFFGMQE